MGLPTWQELVKTLRDDELRALMRALQGEIHQRSVEAAESPLTLLEVLRRDHQTIDAFNFDE